ncbi:MAG: lamin tail domain-containing protein [Bacteroidales bacterium]|nr:lamin tail domain-containing protein [Bacteroidales bacterium]
MKKIILLLLLFVPLIGFSQLDDNFEDGDIVNWTQNNPDHFQASDSLPLNGLYSFHHKFLTDVTGNYKDIASIPLENNNILNGTSTWQFQIQYKNASPSGTNKWNIFLMSDNDYSEMPNGAINGYVIGVNFGSTTDDVLTLRKVSNGTGTVVVATSYTWTTTAVIGIQVTRSSTGDWEIFMDSDGGFNNLISIGTGNDATFTNASYFGVVYDFTKTQCQHLWIDDVTMVAPPGNENNSVVMEGSNFEPETISSLTNTPDGVQVFDIDLQDIGNDGIASIINELTFTQGDNNNIADWTNAIAGAKLLGTDLTTGVEGIILTDGITFETTGLINVDNNTTENYQLYIWLKTDLSNISDNENFEFKIDYSDIVCDLMGSSFGSGIIESGDNNCAVTIVATELNFSDVPSIVAVNQDFTVSVIATDANGNIDLDNNNLSTLTLNTGTGNLSSISGLSQNLNSGQYSWTDLNYNTIENFSITASSTGLNEINSTEITSTDLIYYLDDDFEDGNLTGWTESEIGHWQSSDIEAISGTYSLHHIFDASASGSDKISYEMNGLNINSDSTIWQFELKFTNNSPSGTNNWNVFIMADADNQQMFNGGNINGYVIGVNFTGTDDLLKLWEVTNGSPTEVIATTFDWNNTDASIAKSILITRSSSGLWEIKIDENGGFDNLISLGTANNTNHTDANYFGILYNYSSTLDRLLWLDDIYVGPPIPDIEAPYLADYQVVSPYRVQLNFNEDMNKSSVETTSNYTCDNTLGNPITVIQNPSNKRIVELTFETEFSEDINYNLLIENVTDASDNIIEDTIVEFDWKNIDIESIRFISTTEINVKFTKEIDSATAVEISNYYINNSIGAPTSAILDETNPQVVKLTFANQFIYEQNYTLSIINVEDLFGNDIGTANFNFIFYLVRRNDIVINELMVDVNPAPIALPSYKYIEIYNTSNFELDLTEWTLKIGTNNDLVFPSIQIPSHGYLIICSDEASSSFNAYGQVAGILTESYLTSTTGKTIKLKNTNGQIIEEVTYDPSTWYNDNNKDDGGWAMERIDPTNFCSQNNNWKASENYTGGTPGIINSVFGNNPDTEQPTLEEFTLVASQDIMLKFSETVDTATANSILNYVLNSTNIPGSAITDINDNSIINLHFYEHFLFSDNSLLIKNVSDYCGNAIADTNIDFNYTLIHPTDVEPKSATQIIVYFSEPASKNTAENTFNYSIGDGIGNPIVAYRDANDTSIVHLLFNNEFTEDQQHILAINGITDIYNNVMESEEIPFTFHTPKAFDVVINEIMVDINPAPIGLPEAQYLELFNTTDIDIWLSDWILFAENQDNRVFPTVKIPANGFVIVCNIYDEKELSVFGTTVPILGTSDLTQTGKEIELFDNRNNLIYHVRYSDNWYNDDDKNDGGWALEKIDPYNFCENSFNWAASQDISGGTPGRDNSIYMINPDLTLPKLKKITVKSSNHLIVEFSKNISIQTALNLSNFSVSNLGNPISINLVDTSYSTVNLYFNTQFTDKEQYTLNLSNISDDCSNSINDTSANFVYNLINLEYVWVLNENQIQLKFSEEVELTSAQISNNYFIDNQIGTPSYIVRGTEDPSTIFLQFSSNFSDGVSYTLNISNLKDVNNNTMLDESFEFIYYNAKINDIVINEVLFNPYSGSVDFVELYNRSIYPINLKDMVIAKRDDEGEISSPYKISDNNFIFEPATYLVITTDTNDIKDNYTCGTNFIELNTMPSYADDAGTVVIYDKKDSIIDEFAYNEDMHFSLISNTDGVSLERIDFNQPTQDASNWHSAAQDAGFATPGLINSQYQDISQIPSVGEINLTPDVFSPDNDGYNDQLYINYTFDNGGYFADVYIYDKNGRLVKTLVQNDLLGVDGFWIWDGLDENNLKVRIGIYSIVVNIFDLDGNTHVYKKATVIATKK